MTHEDLMRRLAKMQRLAKNAGTQEEAIAAAEKMQRLMTEHNINATLLGDVDDDSTVEQLLDTAHTGEALENRTRNLVRWRVDLATGVAKLNHCFLYFGWKSGKRCFHLVGTSSNMKSAKYVYDWLCGEVDRITKVSAAGRGRSYASQFRIGMVDILVYRLKRAAADTANSMKEEAQRQIESAVTEDEVAAAQGALVRLQSAIEKTNRQVGDAAAHARKNHNFTSVSMPTGGRYMGNARSDGAAAGHRVRLSPPKRRIA